MKNKTFDDFLNDKCPAELQTNNSPEGYERWLEQLDAQELMDFADEYGQYIFKVGRDLLAKELQPMVHNLTIGLEATMRDNEI